ncbi:MAG: DnaJ domain-containing protein [Candidatus Fermentibacter sp.]|nr:DnaJ domain-containing protein [Candidatus Fermentibacter sp.]
MTAYEVLSLPETATADEVAQAARRLLFEHHPDRGGDPERFKLIARARDLLADPDRRRAYDARLAAWRAAQRPPACLLYTSDAADEFRTV